MATTLDELEAAIAAPVQTESFELVPGVVFDIGAIQGFDTFVDMGRATEKKRIGAMMTPAVVNGRTVNQTDAVIGAALTIEAGVVEPKMDYIGALRLLGRFGGPSLALVKRINELSGLSDPETQIEEAGKQLEADPTGSPSMTFAPDDSDGTPPNADTLQAVN